ncbi:hypothetical protein GUI12_03875 [Anaplasmataceae bacterium AB001_6]|nr:hypothetical protein GUI12_03875 [Anaplasmataceae bacterium AB001_6]
MKIFFLGSDIINSNIFRFIRNLGLDSYVVNFSLAEKTQDFSNDEKVIYTDYEFFVDNCDDAVIIMHSKIFDFIDHKMFDDMKNSLLLLIEDVGIHINDLSDKFINCEFDVLNIDFINEVNNQDASIVLCRMLNINSKDRIAHFLDLMKSDIEIFIAEDSSSFLLYEIVFRVIPIIFMNIIHQIANFYSRTICVSYEKIFMQLIKEFADILRYGGNNMKSEIYSHIFFKKCIGNIFSEIEDFGLSLQDSPKIMDYFYHYLETVHNNKHDYIDILNRNVFYPSLLNQIGFNSQSIKNVLRNIYFTIINDDYVS